MKNRIHPSFLFIRYLHINDKNPSEILSDLFGVKVSEEEIERCVAGIPKLEDIKYPKAIAKNFGCYFIYENKKSLMKFTKNKKKMRFINTALLRGVETEAIVEVMNSNFTELESLLLYTKEDVEMYKRAIFNTDDCDIDSLIDAAEKNPEMIVSDEEVELAEVIFDAGLNVEGDYIKMMNEIAMISMIKARKMIRKDGDEKSISKAEKFMKMGSKAIEVKQKIEEINKNNQSSEKLEEFLIEFDRCGVQRPKTRKEIFE